MKNTVALAAAATVAVVARFCQSEGNDFLVSSALAQPRAAAVTVNPLRDAYFGDLHLHTSYSLDAYAFGTTAIGPDEAYRFARGDTVNYLGQPVRREEPLDFLAVTDHSENLGVLAELENPNSRVSQSNLGKAFKGLLVSITGQEGHGSPIGLANAPPSFWEQLSKLWREYLGLHKSKLPDNLKPEVMAAWAREIHFANCNYRPGKFTTFIAYEWTSMPYSANLHRNVIFKGDTAPSPFTSLDSQDPEDLWEWLDMIRKQGFEALAIPHNANASNGLMYDWIGSSEAIYRAYAEQRQANEPLSEISQTKGASETHPLLSPSDELADYEIYDFLAEARRQTGRPQGSYLRDALSRGLVLERQLGLNPFKYGFVGGSDLHSGLSVSAQVDYGGNIFGANMGGGKPTKAQALSILGASSVQGPLLKTTSGSLTGVWSESNTRESIYNALRRRETFATSGTRVKFRFFGGWDFEEGFLRQRNWVGTAYAHGVPMGGDLPSKPLAKNAPTFVIWAVKDPNSANLDRVQVIKVWEEDGKQREKVVDVAWSGQRRPDRKTGKLRTVGNTVDLKTGAYTNSIGTVQLETVWKDPDFDPTHYAAYYLRVLEIPTPRWSTLLAIHYSLPLPNGVPATEQQRGWSSPIWYSPPAQVRLSGRNPSELRCRQGHRAYDGNHPCI